MGWLAQSVPYRVSLRVALLCLLLGGCATNAEGYRDRNGRYHFFNEGQAAKEQVDTFDSLFADRQHPPASDY